jgi:cytoskeletal protein CcmA (bactofilin family)
MTMTGGPAPTPPVPGMPASGGRSHLVAGTRLTGDLTAPGMLEVQGRIEGRVSADSLVIEERGSVGGEVQGATVTIRGEFDGTLTAGQVRIHASARVSGTILYDSLTVESGAEVTATFTRARATSLPAGAAAAQA